MDELITWLRQQLDEDERVALEASRRWDGSQTPTGEHWRWEETEHDQVLALDPVLDEYLNDGGAVSLRSAEQYPTTTGPLPNFVVPHAEEVRTVYAMHIARWDPARVLAEVEAKRRILDLHKPQPSQYLDGVYVPGEPVGQQCEYCASLCHSYSGINCETPDAPYPCPTVGLLAQPYAGRPGWHEEWRD